MQQLAALLRAAVVDVVQQRASLPVGLLLALVQPEQLQVFVDLGVEERRPELFGATLVEDHVVEDLLLERQVVEVLPEQSQGQDSAVPAEPAAGALFAAGVPQRKQVGAAVLPQHVFYELAQIGGVLLLELHDVGVAYLPGDGGDVVVAAVRQQHLDRPVAVDRAPHLMQVLVFLDLLSADVVGLAVQQHQAEGLPLLVQRHEQSFPALSAGVHRGVQRGSDDLHDFAFDDAVVPAVLGVLDFVHDEDGGAFVEELALDVLDFLAPEVYHEVLRKLLEPLLCQLAQHYRVVLEGEVLHPPELQEHHCSHVTAFCPPVHAQHRAHAFVLCHAYLELVLYAVPTLQKLRPDVLS